jgi:hypothetical protein
MKTAAALLALLTIAALPAAARDIYVSPSGSASGTGSSTRPLASNNAALAEARPGDRVKIRQGVYRERIVTVRSGTSSDPIRITGLGGVIIRPPTAYDGRAFTVYHDHLEITGLTITEGDTLLQMFGVEGVVVEDNVFDGALGECIKLKYRSVGNTIRGNRISRCGLKEFDLSRNKHNGEGIYVGTAPEQESRNADEPVPANAPLGQPKSGPDATRENLIVGNTIDAPAECVEFKENAKDNVARENICTGGRDPDGGAFSARGNANTFERNVVSGPIAGAGFRLGGDRSTDGRMNIVRRNVVRGVKGDVVKDVATVQGPICGNVAAEYGRLSRSGRNPGTPC